MRIQVPDVVSFLFVVNGSNEPLTAQFYNAHMRYSTTQGTAIYTPGIYYEHVTRALPAYHGYKRAQRVLWENGGVGAESPTAHHLCCGSTTTYLMVQLVASRLPERQQV